MTAPLIVDQVSASLQPSEVDLKAWASGRRVFVSSLISDMATERAAVRAAIIDVGAVPVMFEDDLGGQDVPAEEAYLAGVSSSEIYVGLWGNRYGVRMPDGYSATHAEFSAAERHGLRLCLFVHAEDSGDTDGWQRDLIASARNSYTTSPWADPADLAERVKRRLREIAAQELAPWVRVGRNVFRASQIDNDGRTITVMADVRSNQVHAELRRLHENRSGDLPFAAPHVAERVQVTDMSTTTVSAAAHKIRLVLAVQQNRGVATGFGMSGMSADDISRQALEAGLFDLPMPDTYFLSGPVDPLEPIRGFGFEDAIVRPVAQLLITEHLLTNAGADTVDAFTLSPARQGSRRLRVTWTPRNLYINTPDPEPITIDGVVSGI
jgi:hypothetical protein